MAGKRKPPEIPLPKNWGTHVKSRMVKIMCAVKGGEFQWVQFPPGNVRRHG